MPITICPPQRNARVPSAKGNASHQRGSTLKKSSPKAGAPFVRFTEVRSGSIFRPYRCSYVLTVREVDWDNGWVSFSNGTKFYSKERKMAGCLIAF